MELSKVGVSAEKLRKATSSEGHEATGENYSVGERKERKRATYAYLKQHFHITKFIVEAGQKLRLPTVAIATACTLYHQFWKKIQHLGHISNKDFDPYTIATSVVYMASKSEESPRKLRDVINVCHRCLHPDMFLDVGTEYWELRDGLVQCELFILRVLAFKVAVDNPQKYLLHYLKSLQDWVDEKSWTISNLSQICWSIASDSMHTLAVLDYSPSHLAIAVVFFGVLCTGMEIPSQGAKKIWWKAMCSTIDINELQDIIGDLMDLYDYESKPLDV